MPRKNHKNKKYSAELKLNTVKDYLDGGDSQREICKKYVIIDEKKKKGGSQL